jgi:hypothetical protein
MSFYYVSISIHAAALLVVLVGVQTNSGAEALHTGKV